MPSSMESDCLTTLSPEMLKRAKEELGEDDHLRASSITAIRHWLKKQPHLKSACTDAVFLLAFLRTCKFSLEETKRKLDSFMTFKNALPEFYGQWDPMDSNNQKMLSCGISLPLPGYDPVGGKVIIYRPGAYDPYKNSIDHFMRVRGMIGRLMLIEEEQMYITGQVIIMDMKGYSLDHFAQLLSKSTKMISIQEGLHPSRLKQIICINTPAIFQKCYERTSTFMKEKMKRRVIVCPGNGNYESLHKHVSKNILPKDYDGDGLSLAELTKLWKKKVEENRDILMRDEMINKADESKRAGRPKTSRELFGIEGSFRKLNVD